MKSEEYKRGYDAGYKQALLDALRQNQPPNVPEKQATWPKQGDYWPAKKLTAT
jgi:hypothetical protein